MLLCCKVAFSTKNLQLKQFNGNFDTCICLVHLLLSFIYFRNDNGSTRTLRYRIQIFNAEKKR